MAVTDASRLIAASSMTVYLRSAELLPEAMGVVDVAEEKILNPALKLMVLPTSMPLMYWLLSVEAL